MRAISRLALMISLGASSRSVSLCSRRRNRLFWTSFREQLELLVGLVAKFCWLAHDQSLLPGPAPGGRPRAVVRSWAAG